MCASTTAPSSSPMQWPTGAVSTGTGTMFIDPGSSVAERLGRESSTAGYATSTQRLSVRVPSSRPRVLIEDWRVEYNCEPASQCPWHAQPG